MDQTVQEHENHKREKAYSYWRIGFFALDSIILLWYSVILGIESSYVLQSHLAPLSFPYQYILLIILTRNLIFARVVNILIGVFMKPRRWHWAEIMMLILLCGAQWVNTSVLPPKREAALTAEFHRFVARAQPVIDALYAYEGDHGHPPRRLSELVPCYLPRVPDTGVTDATYGHRYGYRRVKNGWRICIFPEIDITQGVMVFDYQSPAFARVHGELSGVVERSKGWMYVRDRGIRFDFWGQVTRESPERG